MNGLDRCGLTDWPCGRDRLDFAAISKLWIDVLFSAIVLWTSIGNKKDRGTGSRRRHDRKRWSDD
ncbi:MAG: hypothetical protein E5X63_39565 [Mesorhizobium sp.]|nr:MAG: hypothetical protein E5X63_39565 [Mesorhizobium sp.]